MKCIKCNNIISDKDIYYRRTFRSDDSIMFEDNICENCFSGDFYNDKNCMIDKVWPYDL